MGPGIPGSVSSGELSLRPNSVRFAHAGARTFVRSFGDGRRGAGNGVLVAARPAGIKAPSTERNPKTEKNLTTDYADCADIFADARS